MTYAFQMFQPKTEIDKKLLASVLQKTYKWLSFIDAEIADKGSYDKLHWSFDSPLISLLDDSTHSTSTIFIEDKPFSQIGLEGDLDNPKEVYGLQSWIEDISNNLDLFIAYEKSIYDILEKLAQEKADDPAMNAGLTAEQMVRERNE